MRCDALRCDALSGTPCLSPGHTMSDAPTRCYAALCDDAIRGCVCACVGVWVGVCDATTQLSRCSLAARHHALCSMQCSVRPRGGAKCDADSASWGTACVSEQRARMSSLQACSLAELKNSDSLRKLLALPALQVFGPHSSSPAALRISRSARL
eukprot:3941403-Rhodomonas_salina.4